MRQQHLWRDEVTVLIAPQHVLVRRVPHRLGRPALTQVLTCGPSEGAEWEQPLKALTEAAANGAWHGAQATVILSNHYVRYMLAPASPGLSGAEYLEFTRRQFTKIFGTNAVDWVLRINPGSPEQPRLASAIVPSLLHSLAETMQTAGMHLSSVQPYLMAVYNEFRRSIGPKCAWLALAEAGRIVVALHERERWLGTWAMRSGAAWGADLISLLDRARFLADSTAEARTVWLHAPFLAHPAFPARPWTIRPLAPWPLSEIRRMAPADAPAAS